MSKHTLKNFTHSWERNTFAKLVIKCNLETNYYFASKFLLDIKSASVARQWLFNKPTRKEDSES